MGIVRRGGIFLDRWYSYKCEHHLLSSGTQGMLVNAIFGLIGEQEGGVAELRFTS